MAIIFRSLLLACLLCTIGVLYFLTCTTQGLVLDIAIAAHSLPGKLKIRDAQGALFTAFSLHNITWQDAHSDLSIKSITVAWHPRELLFNKLKFDLIDIDQANLKIKNNPHQSSSAPINLTNWLKHITITTLHIHQFKIHYELGEIELNGTVQKNWNLAWHVNLPDLKLVSSILSGNLQSNGTLTGALTSPTLDATLLGKKLHYSHYTLNQLTAQTHLIAAANKTARLTVTASGIKYNDSFLKQFQTELTGHFTQQRQSLILNLAARIQQQYRITGQFIFPQFTTLTDLNQPVTGSLHTVITQLDLIQPFVPQIKNLRGRLDIQAYINGTLQQPVLKGNFQLTHGALSVPLLGISPNAISITGNITPLAPVDFNGSFQSGSGHANLNGTVDFNQPNYPVSLSVKGQNLQAIFLTGYNITLSPDVTIQFTNNTLAITGDLVVPKATLTPKTFNTAITLPTDVVFVGEKKSQPSLPFTTTLELNVQLGNEVHITYENLTASLAGRVKISQERDNLPIATGELYTTSGSYKAYGQTLTIQHGRLIYTGGSLLNPGLSIKAVKQIKTVSLSGASSAFSNTPSFQSIYNGTQNLTVGVQVEGTLDEPVVTLFSDPSLNQGDILSYLVFGYPQSQASAGAGGAILNALSSMSPGTDGLTSTMTNKIEKTLGLTEINVQSASVFDPNTNSTVATTEFVVGKQLTPKLSIHYSVGIFYPVSILNLRYELSKRWAIQSETSTIDNGADLLYGIETD